MPIEIIGFGSDAKIPDFFAEQVRWYKLATIGEAFGPVEVSPALFDSLERNFGIPVFVELSPPDVIVPPLGRLLQLERRGGELWGLASLPGELPHGLAVAMTMRRCPETGAKLGWQIDHAYPRSAPAR